MDYVDFSFPDRGMISEYLEKARSFVIHIQEYLGQEENPPAEKC
jgi:hypothetical protein